MALPIHCREWQDVASTVPSSYRSSCISCNLIRAVKYAGGNCLGDTGKDREHSGVPRKGNPPQNLKRLYVYLHTSVTNGIHRTAPTISGSLEAVCPLAHCWRPPSRRIGSDMKGHGQISIFNPIRVVLREAGGRRWRAVVGPRRDLNHVSERSPQCRQNVGHVVGGRILVLNKSNMSASFSHLRPAVSWRCTLATDVLSSTRFTDISKESGVHQRNPELCSKTRTGLHRRHTQECSKGRSTKTGTEENHPVPSNASQHTCTNRDNP